MHTLHSDIAFKAVDGVEIALDVHELPGAEPRPAMLYFHGGALINGGKPMPRVLLDLFAEWGYAGVTANYRLCPEAKWPAYHEDILDAYRWVLENGLEYGIDPERVGVCGGSAGGHLALLVGATATPKPCAVVSFWGYGDLAARWASAPDDYYTSLPPVDGDAARRGIDHGVLTETSDPRRGDFYHYCRQQGTWARAILGYGPDERPDLYEQASPERLVTPDFPPTFFLHGTADTDVPFSAAETMHAALAANAVESHLAAIEGGPHGLWGTTKSWAGLEEPQVSAAIERLREFLATHLDAPNGDGS